MIVGACRVEVGLLEREALLAEQAVGGRERVGAVGAAGLEAREECTVGRRELARREGEVERGAELVVGGAGGAGLEHRERRRDAEG